MTIFKQIQKSTCYRLSANSSNKAVFDHKMLEYETLRKVDILLIYISNQNRGVGTTILWSATDKRSTLNRPAQEHNKWQEINCVSL